MDLRLGGILVARGVLDAEMLEMILEQQRRTGEPLGPLAVRMAGACPRAIEDAWNWQYARRARRLDPETECIEPRALAAVSRRQAWQFRVLPIRFDDGALMLATTKRHLPRALRFATNVIRYPAFFVILETDDLAAELQARYPMRGMDASVVDGDRLETTTWLRHGS